MKTLCTDVNHVCIYSSRNHYLLIRRNSETMDCIRSTIECPKCNQQLESGREFIDHLVSGHNFKESGYKGHNDVIVLTTATKINVSCPKCGLGDITSIAALVDHVEEDHAHGPTVDTDDLVSAEPPTSNYITCPKCGVSRFSTGDEFLGHLEGSHSLRLEIQSASATDILLTTDDSSHSSLPKVGDKVLANWSGSIWQYFHATIRQFMKDELKYEIDWDDGDSLGRMVDYFDLAVDRVPLESEVGVGSIVLFHQGRYRGQDGVRTGGVRWHQGKITRSYTGEDGTKRYDGCHTKGEEDGKWVTFSGYEPTFEGYQIDDFRVGPNVFDIVDDDDSGISADDKDIDVYFSFTPVDSPKAINNNEVPDVPESYMKILDDLCDPIEIASNLKSKGLKVAMGKVSSGAELKDTVNLMKKAKVVVACISDQYAASDQCRMEFQFAKKSLGKPIVPLVVGDGSFEWTSSVVGMLIAGELYIHYKNKSFEAAKNEELFRSLRNHIPAVDADGATDSDTTNDTSIVEGPGDIFISYCWTNSLKAEDAQQIPKCVGTEFSDPRLIKTIISDLGYTCWLDIERLHSANNDAGMFEQLTKALRDAKVILPCISTEYAKSANCRMEFQFALKSLRKPVIPIVVGEGDDWKQTVIGALVSTNEREPIGLQNVTDEVSFQKKMNLVNTQIEEMFGKADTVEKETQEKPRESGDHRAPQVGDHVVCHHFDYAYYMATVVNFDKSTMQYTVDWDDGDPSGRVQPYNQVGVDVVPDPDDVGVGSIIFFPQGSYGGTEGNNTGGERYHEGIVTSVRREDGETYFSGNHTKGGDDGKWVTYRDYEYEFYDLTLSQIRIAPTALDAFTSGAD